MNEARFARLPEPIRLENTITSQDVAHDEPVTDLLVDAWMLKNAAG